MTTVTKATHNNMFNARKTAGIINDTWIFPSESPLAERAAELQEMIVDRVDLHRGERSQALRNAGDMPAPLGDFSPSLFNEIMIKAKEQQDHPQALISKWETKFSNGSTTSTQQCSQNKCKQCKSNGTPTGKCVESRSRWAAAC